MLVPKHASSAFFFFSLEFLLVFMHQPDCAMGYPDIWLNIILGVSVRAFLDEINIGIGSLSKADCPPQSGWISSNALKA